jgi:hypothetical protein
MGDDPAVGCAAEAVVAQVAGQDVVSGVVEDLVVGHQVDFESVASGRPGRVPGLDVGGNAGSAEPQRVVGDDQLARPGRGDEPDLDRHAVISGEGNVFVLEVVLGR